VAADGGVDEGATRGVDGAPGDGVDGAPGDDARAAGPAVERWAVLFVRTLRAAGLDIALGDAIVYLQALGELGMASRSSVYWAGRATLVHHPEDIGVYDRAFAAFWAQGEPVELRIPVETVEVALAFDDDSDDGDAGDDEGERHEGPLLQVRWSGTETLRHKDFADCSVSELDEARRLMAQLRLAGARRRSRRYRQAKGTTARLDLRRTVREALRAGGEAMERSYLSHGERNRRLVLLLDVSGSMEAYSRALLRFVHAAVVGRTKVEAFTIGTRLTRLTRELSSRDPDAAMAKAGETVVDFSGGTRLGETLRQFNDQWGVRGMARGAIVVILSDGWDRGEPGVLAEQMARLHRVAHRVVWVNPLKASPGYAPLAQGMAAALPHVDRFIEGHSLASLEELATVIAA
jgi:uncharacterized protein with von Willebrand factor type A (vWA) domain